MTKIFVKEIEVDGKTEVVEITALDDVQASAFINEGFVEKEDKKKK